MASRDTDSQNGAGGQGTRPGGAPGAGRPYLRYALWALAIVALAGIIFLVTRPAPSPEPAAKAPTGIVDVGNAEFKAAIVAGYQLVDVRTPQEYATNHIPGAVNVPIDVLPQQLGTLDKTKPVAVYCATGARSLNAKQFLAAQGFATVVNLERGIAAWDGPTVAGNQPGDRSAVTAAAGGAPSSSGPKVTVATTGKPVFIDLFSPS